MNEQIDALLEGLNESQRQAVMHGSGPLVVFAGAGSGKTRIITTRIAYLIASGVKPWHILAVTFTNKAAGEMRERLVKMCPEAERAVISTFHACCNRFLREFAQELGFKSDFVIYDDQDSLTAIKNVIETHKIPIGDGTPREYKDAIGRLKTKGIGPLEATDLSKEDPTLFPPNGDAVYRLYQEFLKQCNAMDFGDLILNVLTLLRTNEKVRTRLEHRFRYVLVDEYQDTNPSQFELISYLSSASGNLFVVGDDDQSIYSWRGATPSNIIDFKQIHPNAQHVVLAQNYRCSATIIDAANHLVSHNRNRVPKELWTANLAGEKIEVVTEPDGRMEAISIVQTIAAERDQFPYSDVAIFYRTNSQSRLIEEALVREGIPYRVYGSLRFYERLEIKDMIAYLRLAINESDDMSFKRVINVPARGLGNKAVETIAHEALAQGVSMMAATRTLAESSRIGSKLQGFVAIMDTLKEDIIHCPKDVIERLIDRLDYRTYLKKKHADQAADKFQNVLELADGMREFFDLHQQISVSDYLQSIALSSAEEESVPGVNVMTLHMAKGLEYRRVYIVGVEDRLLPYASSLESQAALEEERRLMYVGITRTKEKLTLTHAERRQLMGQYVSNPKSRFVSEIPLHCFASYAIPTAPLAESQWDDDEVRYEGIVDDHAHADYSFLKGRNVYHAAYGEGRLEHIMEEFGKTRAIVLFDAGRKKVAMHHLELRD